MRRIRQRPAKPSPRAGNRAWASFASRRKASSSPLRSACSLPLRVTLNNFLTSREPDCAGQQRCHPRHPWPWHGTGRHRPRHRPDAWLRPWSCHCPGCSAMAAVRHVARIGARCWRAGFALAIGLVNGILIAYADIPAIFTTLAMGLVVYGAGRAWLFQIDVQNTPAGIAWFDFLGRGDRPWHPHADRRPYRCCGPRRSDALVDPLRALHLCGRR